MNFTSQMRYNPETGEYEKYYRLKESYRNASGRACTRILLNVGFIHGLKPEEIRDISCGLTYKYEHQGEHELWDDQMAVYNDVVRQNSRQPLPIISRPVPSKGTEVGIYVFAINDTFSLFTHIWVHEGVSF